MSEDQILMVKTELPLRYRYVKSQDENAPVLICMHGYTDSPKALERRVGTLTDLGYDLLWPSGPFPVPVKAGDKYKEAFSWYFFDPETNQVFISPATALNMIKAALEHHEAAARPKVLLGFSQGGFLAPILASTLTDVRAIVGIGCLYRVNEYRKLAPRIDVTALHGVLDEVLKVTEAEKTFGEVTALGFKGEFKSFSGLAHTMNDESRKFLKEKLISLHQKL